MFEKYTEDARRAVFVAKAEAARRGTSEIEPPHLVLGILHQRAIAPLLCAGDLSKLEILRSKFAQSVPVVRKPVPDKVDLPLAHASKRVLAYAAEESDRMRQGTINSAHLLLGIHRESRGRQTGILGLFTSPALQEALFLAEHGADYETLRDRLLKEESSD
jgi:ATP-dependent Clp protease ATP-binding subunit ClpC